MKLFVLVVLVACGSSGPQPGGAIELTGSQTGTYERDPTSLTCEPTYVLVRYLTPSKELLLITLYLNTVKDGRAQIALDNSKDTYGLRGNAPLEVTKHDKKTAYKITFDPTVEFKQSDYADANPHSPGGAGRSVKVSGTTTIVCPPY